MIFSGRNHATSCRRLRLAVSAVWVVLLGMLILPVAASVSVAIGLRDVESESPLGEYGCENEVAVVAETWRPTRPVGLWGVTELLVLAVSTSAAVRWRRTTAAAPHHFQLPNGLSAPLRC